MLMNRRCCPCFGDVILIILLASVGPLSRRSLANVDSEIELTLAIVKPDGISGNYTSSIRTIILESGFSIQRELTVQLDEDSVRRFYAEHSTKSFFPSLIKYMTSGPVLIMVLHKTSAIADWRALIGPTDARKAKVTHPDSIRAMCGEDLERNCIHGSDSHESAAREISFFFTETFPGVCNAEGVFKEELLGSMMNCKQFKHSQEKRMLIFSRMFFNWMQSKFNGGQGHKNSNAASAAHQTKQEPRKEEFSDWPQGLLTIGTFGNNDLPTDNNKEIQETSSPDLSEFTPDEIGKLQKELTKLLSKKPTANKQEIAADLPLDRFLNCPSSLEVDRRLSVTVSSDNGDYEEDIDRTIRVILGRCKDICMSNGKKAIGKKSISFLFKKVFVCSGGFLPTPSLCDPLPESRMEKLLRAMLENKINPQNSFRASSARKFLEDRQAPKKGKVKEEESEKDGSKWNKTDSEYIVLEI